jgi:hypothetical protein
MPIARRWMQDMLRVSAATLLVPGAVVAALLAASLGTGLAGLGSLGQLVGGPALPTNAGARAPAPARPAARLPVVPAAAAVAPTPAAAGVGVHGGGGVTSGRPPVARIRPARPGAPRPATSVGVRPSGASSPGPSSGSGAGAPSRPPSQPSPGPIHRLAQPVEQSVTPVPVVGPPAADAVGSVVNLVEPGGAAAATPSSRVTGAARAVTGAVGRVVAGVTGR